MILPVPSLHQWSKLSLLLSLERIGDGIAPLASSLLTPEQAGTGTRAMSSLLFVILSVEKIYMDL
jgi:hypothetical protein